MRGRTKGKLLTRMIVASSVYVLVMVTVLSVLLGRMDASIERQFIQNMLVQLSDKNRDQLDDLLGDMEKMTYSLASSSEVISAMKWANEISGEVNSFDRNPTIKRQLLSLMQMLAGADMGRRSVSLASNRGDIVTLSTYSTLVLSRGDVTGVGRLELLENTQLKKSLLSVDTDPYGRTDVPMFALVRSIADAYRTYGYVEVLNSVDLLNDIFESESDSFAMTTVIFHGDELFYTSDHDVERWTGQCKAMAQLCAGDNVTEASLGDEPSFLYATQIPKQNITLYAAVSRDYYYARMRSRVLVIVLTALGFLVIMIAGTVMVNNHLYRPIRILRDRMEQLKYDGSGTLTLHAEGENDEIALFNQAFSNMLENISRKNDELMSRRMRDLELSYRVLQSQVSPHFLHNTLSVIGFKGEMQGNNEIMDMCSCLSKMMTYSLDTAEGSVRLAQEIEYMMEYLRLMKYRFMERLQIETELSPELDNTVVPKFILQPIVENCFTHGFKNVVVPTYVIRVTGKALPHGWMLQVEDNGSGFSEADRTRVLDEMKHIRDSIAASGEVTPRSATTGIGLINTYARLVLGLRGNGDVKLEIGDSELGGGSVTIAYAERRWEDRADSHDRGGR